MFHSTYHRRPNIFDDDKIPFDKLQKYRNAHPLTPEKGSCVKDYLERLQHSCPPLSNPKDTDYSFLQSHTSLFNTLTKGQKDNSSLHKNNQIEDSAIVNQSSTIDNSQSRVILIGSVTHQEQVGPSRRSTDLEETSFSHSSSLILETFHPAGTTENDFKPFETLKGFAPLNLQDVSLTTSMSFQLGNHETSKNEKNQHKEKMSLDAIEEQEEEADSENREESVKIDSTEDFGNGYRDDHEAPKEDIPSNNKVETVLEKMTEDKAIDTSDIVVAEKEEKIKAAPILIDKTVDTCGLVIGEEKGVGTVEIIKEHKLTDTFQLVETHDEMTDTFELDDDDRRKSIEEIRVIKFKFLEEIHGLRKKLEVMKNEQSKAKQYASVSLKETIDYFSELIKTGLEAYIKEKSSLQAKNLLKYQLELSKTKEQLHQLKSFVLFTMEEIKKKIANYLNQDGKSVLERIIEESSKAKMREIGLSKLGELLGDNHSTTTDSSRTTPMKTPGKDTPMKTRSNKQKQSKKIHRLDPAVVEGLLYLLEHDSLKNPFRTNRDMKDKIEKIAKTNEADKVTSDFVLNSLLERSGRKKSESRPMSEVGEKRSRMNSFHDDEEDDKRSVVSGKVSISTPGKGSKGKTGKRKQRNYENDEDTILEDIDQEQNE